MSKQDMMPPTSTFPTNNNADHVPEVSPSQEQIKLEWLEMKISMPICLLMDILIESDVDKAFDKYYAETIR
jgi:hypothetical protein